MTEWRTVMVHYEVSDQGEVRRGSRILRTTPRNGYSRICLSVGNEKYYTTVHQLVAAAFLGPRPKGSQVAHSNGNRADNRLINLSYKTQAENEADKLRHGTSQHGERNQNARLTCTEAKAIRRRLKAGETGKALAVEYGVSRMAVSSIRTGRTWKQAPGDSLSDAVAESDAP